MSLIFERVQIPGIAALSYFIADDEAGVAAVVDPTLDPVRYVSLAQETGVSITHVFETHIHADFVSGARELCACLGTAQVFTSHAGGAKYGYTTEAVRDHATFTFGSVRLTARHTPGHTPEHVSYLLADEEKPESPWGILSGDSLFVSSVGRPDLLGDDQTDELTQALFRTLREFYLGLPDHVIVYPAHGAGSPCGADIGDRRESTIGYERRHNPFLQHPDYGAFQRRVQETAPPVPTYYPRMKHLNAAGPAVLRHRPQPRALPPGRFEQELARGHAQLVDTRNLLAFGGAHVPNSLHIEAKPLLSIWAGWLLDPEQPLLLVLSDDAELDAAVDLFLRTGYRHFAGYLAGGLTAWQESGRPLRHLRQISVHELNAQRDHLQVVDVRTPEEWREGRVPGAKHLFLPELPRRADELDRARPIAVYCGSGYRASIGASLLLRAGFTDLANVPGSWNAWERAKLPIETDEGLLPNEAPLRHAHRR